MVVSQVKTVDDIKNGNFKIPAPKKLVVENSPNNIADFTPVEDLTDDLPF